MFQHTESVSIVAVGIRLLRDMYVEKRCRKVAVQIFPTH